MNSGRRSCSPNGLQLVVGRDIEVACQGFSECLGDGIPLDCDCIVDGWEAILKLSVHSLTLFQARPSCQCYFRSFSGAKLSK